MEGKESAIVFATWAIVFATLLGPILAVQVQKVIERIKERHSRKTWVFQTLMATRGQRVAPNHVQALNMIDLAFYGARRLGLHHRTKSEQSVIDAWHEYLPYGSPIFKAVQQKRCKASYTTLRRSPRGPECAVGEGSEHSDAPRSVGAP